jgi:ketosteroid isomerase-like protein
MADGSALDVARRAWDYWVAADLPGFLSLWDEDGVWTNGGTSQISGPRQGHAAIAGVAQRVFEISGGTFKAHPTELAAVDDEVVLGRFHCAATRPGFELDLYGLQRMVIRNGKLHSLDNLYGDGAAWDAFFA